MKWFNNLRVGAKIVIMCAAFIVLMLVISTVGIRTINGAVSSLDSFYGDIYQPTRKLNRIMRDMLQVRVNMIQEQLALLEAERMQEAAAFQQRVRTFRAFAILLAFGVLAGCIALL